MISIHNDDHDDHKNDISSTNKILSYIHAKAANNFNHSHAISYGMLRVRLTFYSLNGSGTFSTCMP